MVGQQDQLLAAALAGDSLAVQRLLLSQFSPLERHIAGRIPADLRSLISAEDVLQETLTQAFRDVAQLSCQHEGEFAAWLRTVAEHRLSDAVKKHKRKKRGGGMRPVGEKGRSSDSLGPLLDRVCEESRTPGRSVARREMEQVIRVHIAALPDAERAVIVAYYLEGREVAEIAEAMGRSPAAVRGLLHRAHRRLSELMGRSSRWFST